MSVAIACGVCACGIAEIGLLDDGGTKDVFTPDVKQDVVTLGDATIDASTDTLTDVTPPPDAPNADAAALCAATCPNAGGVCLNDGTCYFDCTLTNSCTSDIHFPANIPCAID